LEGTIQAYGQSDDNVHSSPEMTIVAHDWALGLTIQYGVLLGNPQFHLRTGAGDKQNEKESDA